MTLYYAGLSSYPNSRLKSLKFAALSMEVESRAIYGN
jgi:hypothetical protein